MPRLYDFAEEEDASGRLRIKHTSSSVADAFYVLSQKRTRLWHLIHNNGNDPDLRLPEEVLLLSVNLPERTLTIHPRLTRVSNVAILESKHKQITKITIDLPFSAPTDGLPREEVHIQGILEDLPLGFTKDYEYGLGLARPYRPIVEAIETLTSCTHLRIDSASKHSFQSDASTFVLSAVDYHAARRSIDRITDSSQIAARTVRQVTTYNFMAKTLGQPAKPIALGRNPLRQAFTVNALGLEDHIDVPLADRDQNPMIEMVSNNVSSIARKRPESLLKLKNEIELATLDSLIHRYETMLGKHLTESKWQGFLKDNAFILTLAFGHPVILVGNQPTVGGHTLAGTGGTIADFLAKHSMTNNAALIEIKRPDTQLLGAKPIRGQVYAPHRDLVGAINQALDQKDTLERNIATLKDNSGVRDLETYSVQCSLIVGTLPGDGDKRRSFEMFRGNSKDVAIFTFDELLQKLKNIKGFLDSQ